MRRELEGLSNRVQHPAQYDLPGGPTAVSLEEFLEGDGLNSVVLVSCWLGQHLIHSFEEVAAQGDHALSPSLS